MGLQLDGAFSVCVTDGVDVGVAGPAGAHAVLLLTEQRGGLSGPVLRASGGRGLLRLGGEGGGQRRVQGTRRCAHGGGRGLG